VGREWVPLEVLVESALARTALEPVRAPRFARALPTLSVVLVRYDHHEQDLGSGGSSGWFDAAVVLEWGLGRAPVEPDPSDPDLVEIDGRWLVDDGTADPVLARAIARHGADYRAGLVAGVDRLYAARQRLASAQPEGELLERVLRDLQVQELDARLDFVSGGAVAAWGEPRGRHAPDEDEDEDEQDERGR
jgi:hypothetical protein